MFITWTLVAAISDPATGPPSVRVPSAALNIIFM